MTKRKDLGKLQPTRMGETEGSLAERLEHYSMPIPHCGCHIWIGGLFKTGYGALRVRGEPVGTHRLSWELAHGPIPDGLYVLHRCDNRACINPDHLFLGTHLDNIADMNAKGRHFSPRGEKSSKAKLTADQVRRIRSASGPQRRIAEQFGVTHHTVGAIRRGESWSHVT